MPSLPKYTLLSNAMRVQYPYRYDSASTQSSSLELPRPILSDTGTADAPGRTLVELYGPCGMVSCTGELPEALNLLRTLRRERTSVSSSSSSESVYPLPARDQPIVHDLLYDPVSAARVIEWRRTLDLTSRQEMLPIPHGPWDSFLPSCGSSSEPSMSSYYESDMHAGIGTCTGRELPNHARGLHWNVEDNHSRGDEVEAEAEAWPYDGRGIYQHHSKKECGSACHMPCRLRRKFRPRLTQLVHTFLARFKGGKHRGKWAMKNSDIPHPPWTLEYRSNDDTLDEDHDDGDLEVWLEYVTEKQNLDHELRLEIPLDGFQHTAFCLRQEARLDVSPNAKVHIPRGGLVTLLQKALLYIEVETHWRRDPNAACISPFSLLSAHVCSSSSITPASPGSTPRADKTNGKAADKRRMSPKSANRGQKRARLENTEAVEKEPTPVSSRGAPASTDKSKKSTSTAVAKTKPRKEPEPELEPVILLKGHTQEVFVVAWNPNIPNLLATGGKDATVRIWNVPDNAKEPIFPSRICMHLPASPNCDITTITWNGDGSLLATGSYDGIIRVWTYRGELFTVLTQHQGPIFSIKWSKEGLLLTGSLDDSAIVWDVENGGKAKQRFTRHRDGCLDVEWLEKDFFASCGTDRNIFIEHIGDTTSVARLAGHHDEINQIKYQSEFKLLASGSDDYCACIWNLSDVNEDMFKTGAEEPVKPRPEVRRPNHILRGHSGEVANISWEPRNGREPYEPILVTSSFDGTVRMWNGITGACLSVFSAGCGKVCGHSFTPSGDLIAIVAGGKLILAKNGKEFFSWEDERNLYETGWRVDGKMVAAAMESHQIVVVNTKALKIPEDEPEDSGSGEKAAT